jgi:putative FmdB family regulatory protein
VPLYNYKCTKCGHEFEGIARYSESATKPCPECEQTAEKQVSATENIKFTGICGSATM